MARATASKTKRRAAPKRQPTKRNDSKTARLNLLIRPDLKEWAHEYAARRHKSVSSLINDYLLTLREKERGDCVEQI